MPRIAIDLEGKFSLTNAVWSGGSGSSEIWACWDVLSSSNGAKTQSDASQALQSCKRTFGSTGVGSSPQGIFDATFAGPNSSIQPVLGTEFHFFLAVSRVTLQGQEHWSWSASSRYNVDYVGQAAEIEALRASYLALHLGRISASVVRSAGDLVIGPRYTLEISHALNEPIAAGLWQGGDFYFSVAQFWLCPTVPSRYFAHLGDVGCLEIGQFMPPTDGPRFGGLSYRNVALDYGSFDIEPIEQMRKSAHVEVARFVFQHIGPSPRAEIYTGWHGVNLEVTRPGPTLHPSVEITAASSVEPSTVTSGFSGALVSRLETSRVKVGEAGMLTLHGKRLSSIRTATIGGKSVRLGPIIKNGTKERRQVMFTGIERIGSFELILESSRGRLTLARAVTVFR